MVKYLLMLFTQCLLLYKCGVNGQDILKDNLFVPMINELYLLYKDAYENEKTYVTRRFFTNHNHYTLHVEKLKEVNGWKTHNLRIESKAPWGNPVVYINNPVESHMPNAFISREEFQKLVVSRIEQQKKKFSKDTIDLIQANKYFKSHTPLPSSINGNIHQVMDKLHQDVIDAIDYQIERDTDDTNTKATDELMVTPALHKTKPQAILRNTSSRHKNTEKHARNRTIPDFKIAKKIQRTAKRKSLPTHKNKAAKSNILSKLHLASNKAIKRKVSTTKPTRTIPVENKMIEEVRTNIITNSTETIETTDTDATVNYPESTAKLISTDQTTDVATEAVVSSTKENANEMIKEITETVPEVAATRAEKTKNTDIDATVQYTESIASLTSTNPRINITTEAVVRNNTDETTATVPEIDTTRAETTKNKDLDATVDYTESTAKLTSTESIVDVTTREVVSSTVDVTTAKVVSSTTVTTEATTKPTGTTQTRLRKPYVFME